MSHPRAHAGEETECDVQTAYHVPPALAQANQVNLSKNISTSALEHLLTNGVVHPGVVTLHNPGS